MEDFLDTTSPLHDNFTAQVPTAVTNPASITKYLGVKDWYTMNFYTNCSGFFAPSSSNPSLLTRIKVDVVCTKRAGSYTFSLGQILEGDLNPAVLQLENKVG
jgi:hypothetical protein